MRLSQKNKIIIILGPTASGKTKLAVKLAARFNGEIISADSRQIYKGMDIGTGKDKQDYIIHGSELKKIPVHLIDILKPDQKFSLAQYQKLCFKKINQIIKRGCVPVVAGGTGLYIEAILNNYNIPKIKPDYKLRAQLEKMNTEKLAKKLNQLDKNIFKKTDKKNKRRLIRGIEVALNKKNKRDKITSAKNKYNFIIIGIKKPINRLEKLINKRVDKMIAQGLAAETKKLIEAYGADSMPLQTIGYKEIILYLDKKNSLKQAVADIKLHTRQFAKRQMTWFNGMKNRNSKNKINWIMSYGQAEKIIENFL